MSSSPTPPADPSDPIPPEIESAAADWLARRDAGLSPAETARFYQWLSADSRHAAAWAELESAWAAFDAPRQRGESPGMIHDLAARRRRRQWRIVVSSAVALSVSAAAVWVFVLRPTTPSGAVMVASASSSLLVKPNVRVLPDGTIVQLKPGGEIAVNYSAARRDVQLVRGEAHFTVTKNPARPFVVTTDSAKVQAVGTAFAVRLGAESIDVLVTEGKVAVARPAAADRAAVSVAAGNYLTVPANPLATDALAARPISGAEMEQQLAWRTPHLELAQTPLEEVVRAFNRENRVQLAIADATLSGMRLTGAFRADRPEDFVRLLELHYGVRAERRNNAIVLRRAR